MKTIKSFASLKFWIIYCLFNLVIISCQREDLQIERNFPFEVYVMPVPKDIAINETIEIRLKILPSTAYSKAEHFIRYFQFDGTGLLKSPEDEVYALNDLYILDNKEFRLYYTSTCSTTQSFDIWISDQSGNEKHLKFQINAKN